jgi:CheY-like chemotaxis protein
MFRADAERQDIQVVLDVGEGVPDGVMGDAPRLQQVLLNLLGNGLKFTERGSVTLRLRALTGRTASLSRVRFEVIDTGIGIPQVAQAQIFQPFHQVDGTRSRLHGGIGLGLSISQRIVEAMGGQVQVISRAGSGSTFFFELDLPLASTGVPRPLSDSEFGSLDRDMSLHGTVLLVEDNMVNRLIAVEMLRSFGLEVIEAEDGAQALTLLDQQSVDLVLMDIHMPVLDGYAATQKARKRETALRLPRVPIVALTANAFEEDTRRSLEVGMDAHLAKPYSRVQLHKVLQRWLA